MTPTLPYELEPRLENAPGMIGKLRQYKAALYASAVLAFSPALAPDTAEAQTQSPGPTTTEYVSNAVETQDVTPEIPNIEQPLWARSPSGRVLATRWACKPPEQYTSFLCPAANRQRPGTMLFEYDSNGGRTSQAMLYLPERAVAEFQRWGVTKSRPLAIYLHGRGPGNVADNQYTGYWSSGLFPTPAEKSSYEERMQWASNHYGIIIAAPEGQGRVLKGRSWGYQGQIEDIAKMPNIIRKLLPYVRIDSKRIYAFGSSMGGHESMQVINQYPNIFAAGYSDDGVSNWVKRYFEFKNGVRRSGAYSGRSIYYEAGKRDALLESVVQETGGNPSSNSLAYLKRSPIYWLKTRGPAVCKRPMFVGINTNDSVVPNSQSEEYVNTFRRKCGTKNRNLVVSYTNGGHSSQTQRSSGYTTPLNFFRNGGRWIIKDQKYRR